jgi:demethylmenaquinone methyltransferase/2-methoxy-6-polyprenyl-1,4-benzoquinol methylase
VEKIMAVSYTLISKIYGLLDVVFFKDNGKNPRKILLSKIPNEDINVLEIAVGTAQNCILLAKNREKIDITGIDLSDDMLGIARKSIKKKNINNISLVKMNAENMSFDNEKYDVIIVSLLLHELSTELGSKILLECKRVLKKTGKIYVIEWEKPKRVLQKIKFLSIDLFEPKEYKVFMKLDFQKYISNVGLKIVSIEYGDYTKVVEIEKER